MNDAGASRPSGSLKTAGKSGKPPQRRTNDLWGAIDRLFDAFASGRPLRRGDGDNALEQNEAAFPGWSTGIFALHLVDKDDELLIQAELPGMGENDLEIERVDGMLRLRGSKTEEREEGEEGSRYHVKEQHHNSFERAIRLPDGVDQDKIDAKFRDGVLTIILPKIRNGRGKGQ